MRRIFYALVLTFLLGISNAYAAWDATKPQDNEKLKDTPALLRANFSAIQTGTDANLCINNAKTCAAAGIVDSKLAQITTASKVSGTALCNLTDTPTVANNVLPIGAGGTGQNTAQTARNALLPTQTGNSGKVLVTDGSNWSCGYPASLTVTSQAIGDLLYFDGTKWNRFPAGTDGYFLKAKGAAAPEWTQPNVANGPVILDGSTKLPAVDGSQLTGLNAHGYNLYTNVGTTSWTAPTGVTKVFITLVGGGGGGGKKGSLAPGQGGCSGYAIANYPYTVVGGNSYTVVVGDGGAAGTTAAGTQGADSSFDGTLVSKGGLGGAKGETTFAIPEITYQGFSTCGLTGNCNGSAGMFGTGAGCDASSAGHAYGGGGGGGQDGGVNTPGKGGSGMVLIVW